MDDLLLVLQRLGMLAVAIGAAVLGTVLPFDLKRLKEYVSHPRVKLINECLAKHQMAYLIFDLCLLATGKFESKTGWGNGWLIAAAGVAFFLYWMSIKHSAHQDEKIAELDKCPGPECRKKASFRATRRVLLFNAFMTLFSLALTVLLAWKVA